MKDQELDKLADLLFALASHLHREIKARTEIHLNASQIGALMFIRCHPDSLMREIAQYLSIQPPSATTLVEELQQMGFVHRSPDPDDKRSVRVALTAQGQSLIRDRMKVLIERIDEITRPLTSQEKTHFIQALEKILSTVDRTKL